MKRKGTPRRVLTVVLILAICGIFIAASSGWANTYKNAGKNYSYNQGSQHHYTSCGDGSDCSYNQGSQHHYTSCGDGNDCGCQPSYYVYYYSGSGKCGQPDSCPPIEKPERPDCSTIAVPTTAVTPSIPQLNIPKPPTTTPVTPPSPAIPSIPTIP